MIGRDDLKVIVELREVKSARAGRGSAGNPLAEAARDANGCPPRASLTARWAELAAQTAVSIKIKCVTSYWWLKQQPTDESSTCP